MSAASPSSIAKVGVVFLDPTTLGWLTVWRARVASMDQELLAVRVPVGRGAHAGLQDAMLCLAHRVITPALAMVRHDCEAAVPLVSDLHSVTTLLTLLESMCLQV
ncbi:hypothetical protein T484DRAFT_2997867 [Baffinella frigidus]|nr:hypothetical protein T484DRAFT_2997867 [Cryptophyta sp. CCMP2293]